MTPTPITLVEIREAAAFLANRHNDVAACAAHLNAEIKAAIAPIVERYRETMDRYAAAEADAQARLHALVSAVPQLFAKPRSLVVDGVRAGYRKEEDRLDWSDEESVIARIRALRPDLAPVLIRTSESLIVDALPGLSVEDLQAFGIRTVAGADQVLIKIGDNDVERLAAMVISAAAARQGDEEKPRAIKGKAKAGKGVPA